jgi:hypothetical protein
MPSNRARDPARRYEELKNYGSAQSLSVGPAGDQDRFVVEGIIYNVRNNNYDEQRI